MNQIIILFVAFLVSCGVHAEPVKTYPYVAKVKTDSVNLRSGPGMSYDVVSQLNQGEFVVVWDLNKEWLQVEPPQDAKFWVHNSLLDGNTVNAYSVNVRSKPSTYSSIVCQLEKDFTVSVLEIQEEWTAIKPPKHAYVWLHQSLVEYYENYDVFVKNQTFQQIMTEKKDKLNHLWNQADEFERSQMYLPNEDIDFDQMRENFLTIIEFAPESEEAIAAKERIELLNVKQQKVEKEIDEKERLIKEKNKLENALDAKESQIKYLESSANEKDSKKLQKGFKSSGLVRYDGSKTRLK